MHVVGFIIRICHDARSHGRKIIVYLHTTHIYRLLLFILPTNARTHEHTHICIKISSYITYAPTCFGASAPSSRSFDIAFAKVIKY